MYFRRSTNGIISWRTIALIQLVAQNMHGKELDAKNHAHIAGLGQCSVSANKSPPRAIFGLIIEVAADEGGEVTHKWIDPVYSASAVT